VSYADSGGFLLTERLDEHDLIEVVCYQISYVSRSSESVLERLHLPKLATHPDLRREDPLKPGASKADVGKNYYLRIAVS